jgi:hypothetical protein
MYDIYLSKGSNHILDINQLVSKNSGFINSGLLTSIKLRSRQLGLLGLDLPSNTAAELLESLTLAGARGLVIASEYRQPQLTVEDAVLLLDAGNLVTVFKRVSTELLVNQEWCQRNNLGLFEVGIDGKIRQLSQPAMST